MNLNNLQWNALANRIYYFKRSCFLIIYKIKVCILLCFRFGHIGFRLYLKLSVINFRPLGQTCIRSEWVNKLQITVSSYF